MQFQLSARNCSLPLKRGIYSAQEHSMLPVAEVYAVAFYEAALYDQKLGTLPPLQTGPLGQIAPLHFSPRSPRLAPQQAARLPRAAGAGIAPRCPRMAPAVQEATWLERHWGCY